MNNNYITLATSFILLISVYLIWKQNKINHEWNLKRASFEILKELIIEKTYRLHLVLKDCCQCDIYNDKENYENTTDKNPNNKKEVDRILSEILSIFEIISVCIKNKIIDEDICYNCEGFRIVKFYRWAKPYINEKRKLYDEQGIWSDYEILAEKWEQRVAKDKKKHKEAIIIPASGLK